MFTGIIEETGKIKNMAINGNSGTITISASKVIDDTKIGDSIATDGICLTVTDIGPDHFTADVMAETVRRSCLAEKQAGDEVNLERAMAADGRFGGHIVSGHIDGTGTIREMSREENSVWIKIECEGRILRYIIEKGSITIDGISLTVAEVTNRDFSVSVIPHTGEETTLLKKKPGNKVNLENDIVGKYVEKLMNPEDNTKKLTLDFLEKNGF